MITHLQSAMRSLLLQSWSCGQGMWSSRVPNATSTTTQSEGVPPAYAVPSNLMNNLTVSLGLRALISCSFSSQHGEYIYVNQGCMKLLRRTLMKRKMDKKETNTRENGTRWKFRVSQKTKTDVKQVLENIDSSG